jgi:hypothetical protein
MITVDSRLFRHDDERLLGRTRYGVPISRDNPGQSLVARDGKVGLQAEKTMVLGIQAGSHAIIQRSFWRLAGKCDFARQWVYTLTLALTRCRCRHFRESSVAPDDPKPSLRRSPACPTLPQWMQDNMEIFKAETEHIRRVLQTTDSPGCLEHPSLQYSSPG